MGSLPLADTIVSKKIRFARQYTPLNQLFRGKEEKMRRWLLEDGWVFVDTEETGS